jgi:hypothetical protein
VGGINDNRHGSSFFHSRTKTGEKRKKETEVHQAESREEKEAKKEDQVFADFKTERHCLESVLASHKGNTGRFVGSTRIFCLLYMRQRKAMV